MAMESSGSGSCRRIKVPIGCEVDGDDGLILTTGAKFNAGEHELRAPLRSSRLPVAYKRRMSRDTMCLWCH